METTSYQNDSSIGNDLPIKVDYKYTGNSNDFDDIKLVVANSNLGVKDVIPKMLDELVTNENLHIYKKINIYYTINGQKILFVELTNTYKEAVIEKFDFFYLPKNMDKKLKISKLKIFVDDGKIKIKQIKHNLIVLQNKLKQMYKSTCKNLVPLKQVNANITQEALLYWNYFFYHLMINMKNQNRLVNAPLVATFNIIGSSTLNAYFANLFCNYTGKFSYIFFNIVLFVINIKLFRNRNKLQI